MHSAHVSAACQNKFDSLLTIWRLAHIQDGYTVDKHGVHHRVLDAVLESMPGTDCFGWVDMYSTHLNLTGVGDLQSQHMPFDVAQQAIEGLASQTPDADTQEQAALDRQPV